MFKINNLNVSVNDKNILNDLNVELPDGQIHVIMGKNGIGKSTLCKVIMVILKKVILFLIIKIYLR